MSFPSFDDNCQSPLGSASNQVLRKKKNSSDQFDQVSVTPRETINKFKRKTHLTVGTSTAGPPCPRKTRLSRSWRPRASRRLLSKSTMERWTSRMRWYSHCSQVCSLTGFWLSAVPLCYAVWFMIFLGVSHGFIWISSDFRPVPADHGLRLLEGWQDRGQSGVRPLLPKEPLPRRVYYLRRPVRVPQVSRKLQILRKW